MPESKTVFLFDVDNTLLDNDRVTADLGDHLESAMGKLTRERYFAIFEDLRREVGYADYLGALQRYRIEHPQETRLLEMSAFFLDYPFADRLYPGALSVLAHCAQAGPVVILSDGDVVFQPLKVRHSGIFNAVAGRVLIYIHKEQMLAEVEKRYPAQHYVFVDDKPRLVKAIKDFWKTQVTVIWPRQGHYAAEIKGDTCPGADVAIQNIADLAELPFSRLFPTPA